MSDNGFTRLKEIAGLLPYMGLIGKYSKISMAEMGKRYKNPLLRKFFTGGNAEKASGVNELASLAIMFSLGWMADKNAGYPLGGSLKMIKLVEDNYRSLGGKIQFRKRVEKIIVEDGSAKGVVFKDGSEVRADIVVSTADGYATLYKMLEGKYIHPKHENAYRNYQIFPSYLQVSFGVDYDFAGEPGFLTLMLNRSIKIDPETSIDSVTLRVFNYDRTLSPAGKTAVVVFIACYNYKYWQEMRDKDRDGYRAEKERVAKEITAVLEERFPAVKGKIEETDVATPASVIRYTGNWKGSMEGWLPTPKTGFGQLPMAMPGLKDFYMVGQWTMPGGGLPGGLLGGRSLAKKVCREYGGKFKGGTEILKAEY